MNPQQKQNTNNGSHQVGYNELFVEDVPDYLRCVACQFVLRDALLILQCGHKICSPCFQHLQDANMGADAAAKSGANIRCPVDVKPIDLNCVFPDIGVDRLVGDLQVKCTHTPHGCTWVGELRDIDSHATGCAHRRVSVEAVAGSGEVAALLNGLYERVGKCEFTIADKDKEVARLVDRVESLERKLDEKSNDNDRLKERNEKLESVLDMIAQQNEKVKFVETRMKFVEMETAELKNAGEREGEMKHVTLGSGTGEELEVLRNDLAATGLRMGDVVEQVVEVRRSLAKMKMETVCTGGNAAFSPHLVLLLNTPKQQNQYGPYTYVWKPEESKEWNLEQQKKHEETQENNKNNMLDVVAVCGSKSFFVPGFHTNGQPLLQLGTRGHYSGTFENLGYQSQGVKMGASYGGSYGTTLCSMPAALLVDLVENSLSTGSGAYRNDEQRESMISSINQANYYEIWVLNSL